LVTIEQNSLNLINLLGTLYLVQMVVMWPWCIQFKTYLCLSHQNMSIFDPCVLSFHLLFFFSFFVSLWQVGKIGAIKSLRKKTLSPSEEIYHLNVFGVKHLHHAIIQTKQRLVIFLKQKLYNSTYVFVMFLEFLNIIIHVCFILQCNPMVHTTL